MNILDNLYLNMYNTRDINTKGTCNVNYNVTMVTYGKMGDQTKLMFPSLNKRYNLSIVRLNCYD